MEVNLQQDQIRSSNEPSTEVDNSSGATSVNLRKFHYTWTISNYSFTHKRPGLALTSPPFFVGTTNNKSKWKLLAYPNGDTYDSKDYLGIFLCFVPGYKSRANARFKFSILNSKKEEMVVKEFTRVWHFAPQCPWTGWAKCVKRSFLESPPNDCLPEDCLTIVCDIVVVENIANTAEENDLIKFNVPKCRLLDDVSGLFESTKLCDVTLVTPGRVFEAHKVILAARSPIFSAMFEHEMLEKKLSQVVITDVDDDVLKEMLRFIYTGETRNLDYMADRLLAAANKYELGRLKGLCEVALCRNLAVENAAGRLMLGDLHGSVHLKTRALDFICTHAKDVMETASYKAMHYTHPYLIDQAFQAIATNKSVPTASAVGVSHYAGNRGQKRKNWF